MVLQTKRPSQLARFMPKSLLNGQIISEPVSSFLTRNPIGLASCTCTVSGTLSNNDQLRLNVILPGLPGGMITKTVTLVTDDTVSNGAQRLVKALNDDATLRAYGCYATAILGVITFYWPGLLGNSVSLTQSVPVGSGVLTLGNGGLLAGGSGPVVPSEDFDFNLKGQHIRCRAGEPITLGANVVVAMAAAGSPIQ